MQDPVEAARDLNLVQALAVEARLRCSGIDCYVSRDQVAIPSALHNQTFSPVGPMAARCRVLVRAEVSELARDIVSDFLRRARERAMADAHEEEAGEA